MTIETFIVHKSWKRNFSCKENEYNNGYFSLTFIYSFFYDKKKYNKIFWTYKEFVKRNKRIRKWNLGNEYYNQN